MQALDRKLWRELWAMRGQALAIALVIASGVAVYVMSLSTLDSLRLTQASYYRAYGFAEVFAGVKRAPEALAARVAEMPGVAQVESRVVAQVLLDVEGFPDPATGRLISLPARGEPVLNRLYLRAGRLPEPGRDEEVVAADTFADAHGLEPGDTVAALINGHHERLRIVGIGLSPEYVYQIAPGAIFPDFKRYGVLWMGRDALAAAYGMEEAFNDLSLTLTARTNPEDVIDRLDQLLDPYGGRGAYPRKDQLSHRFLSEELKQLGTMATLFPLIFLGVAAFLLNVVITRLVSTQRELIAVLKAFGYSNRAVGLHYLKLVLLIVLLGVAVGVLVGVWLGANLSALYTTFYRFPFLQYVLNPHVVLSAVSLSAVVAAVGTLIAVRAAALLPPAQAMRPEQPQRFRPATIERAGLRRWLSQPTRIIARNIERRPLKSLLSVIGLAFACGIMMVGNFQEDAIRYMVDVQFRQSQREDLSVRFVDPTAQRALYSLRAIPGVEHIEAVREVPVRLRFEHRSYRTGLQGIDPHGELVRVLDNELRPLELPSEGIVLTDHLGKILGARPGDLLTVEVLEGERPVHQLPIVGLTKQYLGINAYMRRDALNRALKEGNAISGAYLAVDERARDAVYAELKELPRVAGVTIQEAAIQTFWATMAETILFFTFISTLLGGIIAFGVVYNSARIALSERGRELASLRVLGFTQGEIGYILLGELGTLTLAAIPLGFVIGRGLCGYLSNNLQSDLYRVPLVLELDTYAYAAATVLASAVISGYLIWRQLGRLDLIAVLKTRE